MMDSGDRPLPSEHIESVDNAMRVFEFLKDHDEIRVVDLARELGIARSSAHRLLSTLSWRGYLEQKRGSKSYRVGPALIAFGLRWSTDIDLKRVALPHMHAVRTALDETVSLAVLYEEGCRFIESVRGSPPHAIHSMMGVSLPAYATAGGKVLLADLPRTEILARYPHGYRRLSERTHRSSTALLEDLDQVRGRGFAVNAEESVGGIKAVAVPIRDRVGRTVAALTIGAYVERFSDEATLPIVRELRKAATLIRNDLR